jgi:hypothetical protein
MPTSDEPRTDLAAQLDALHIAVGKTDALAHATEEIFDNTGWSGEVDQQRLERVAHLVGSVAEAAAAAVAVVGGPGERRPWQAAALASGPGEPISPLGDPVR